MHDSEYLVCDGTFEMVPDSSYQLYTVHFYSNGEGMVLAWALLLNKSTAIYVEMFTSIRDALVEVKGHARCQYTMQCRGIQLAAGRRPQSQRASYRNLDDKIMKANVTLSQRIGPIFADTSVQPEDWRQFADELSLYLQYTSYLILRDGNISTKTI